MRIVAFLDNSIYAQSVIDHAGWLARASGAGLDLVQIVSPNELMAARMAPIHPGGSAVLSRDGSIDRQVADLKVRAGTQLDDARGRLAEQGLTDVRISVVEGVVSQLMIEIAADTHLVVLGKRGEDADLARLPLGSNLEHFVRSTDVPVLAVSRTYRPINRMLVGFDFDSASASVVATLASGHLPRLPIQLLHVGDESDALRLALDRSAAILGEAGHEVTTEIAGGIPRVVIPERVVSDQIDLVAIGAFSRSRIKSLIFGSLTSEVIRACQVPILLGH